MEMQTQNSALPVVVDSAVSNAKIKRDELIMFTTQLSIMLDSGVVLSDALEAMAEQLVPCTLRDINSRTPVAIKNIVPIGVVKHQPISQTTGI